jgi:GNAT superfamily N-acetyltransferase
MFEGRDIGPGDVALVCDHRERMFAEAGHDQRALKIMAENFRPWLHEQIEIGRYLGRVVECEGEAVASIGLMVIAWPPHPMHPAQGARGYVLNLFVEPQHRRKGIGRALMAYADRRFSEMGIEYRILHSTRMAREMYEGLGWKATTEMAFLARGSTR